LTPCFIPLFEVAFFVELYHCYDELDFLSLTTQHEIWSVTCESEISLMSSFSESWDGLDAFASVVNSSYFFSSRGSSAESCAI